MASGAVWPAGSRRGGSRSERSERMPIMIQYQGAAACPVIVCDHCKELITTAKDGNYQWYHGEVADGAMTPMYFTHKRCCHGFEHTHGEASRWSAIGLDALPAYLLRNLKLTAWAAQAAAERMSRLG